MVLLDDVDEIFGLKKFDVHASVDIDAFDGSGVGTAFVDRDLPWQAVQVDGRFEVSSGSCQVALDSEEEVRSVA